MSILKTTVIVMVTKLTSPYRNKGNMLLKDNNEVDCYRVTYRINKQPKTFYLFPIERSKNYYIELPDSIKNRVIKECESFNTAEEALEEMVKQGEIELEKSNKIIKLINFLMLPYELEPVEKETRKLYNVLQSL